MLTLLRKSLQLKFKKFRGNEEGQALAEIAITILVFLMIILGIIQLSMVMNAKMLVNYAAYCAARAGIVHNGDEGKMKQAAAVALAPLFTYSSSGLFSGYNAANSASELKVEIVSPGKSRFSSSYDKRFFPEYHKYSDGFKNSSELDNNLLVVKVTYDYPLEIPFINKIISPSTGKVKIASTCRMRMQSDSKFQ